MFQRNLFNNGIVATVLLVLSAAAHSAIVASKKVSRKVLHNNGAKGKDSTFLSCEHADLKLQ
jgi:hypothetical protein